MITIDDIYAARDRLASVAHRTPVLTSQTLNTLTGTQAFLKAECFQRAGAFKFRGAYNAISSLGKADLKRGIAAWSSGNHAQAVALAASMHHTKATILMPADAPAAKVAATRGYGAEIVTYDRYTQDRLQLAEQLRDERGLTGIPPYDHPAIMAGQGTAALELIEDVKELDTLMVCVSGGGLMAGCGTAAKALLPGIELVGVEPEDGNDTQQSLAAGKRIKIPVPRTIADGLQVEIPGELTFEVNKRQIDAMLTVTDADIVRAMIFVFERMKVVLEPSGATALAALMTNAGRFRGKRVGVILSGGNVGARRFCELTGELSS